MKKSELRKLAQQIAKSERIIQTSQDKDRVMQAQADIIELSSHISIFDLEILDDMIQEILLKS